MKKIKGIVLAGGLGTRLYPATIANSKQLLPVHDKPMIYYPISTLLSIGITDLIIIIKEEDKDNFQRLFSHLKDFKFQVKFVLQKKPNGIAEAYKITKELIKNYFTCLILGDNIFYGNNLTKKLKVAKNNLIKNNQAQIFANYVKNPNNYGVVEFDKDHKILKIIEKPKYTKSNYAIPGIYFFPPDVINKYKYVKLSKRNEYEIVDLQNIYLKEKRLILNIFDRDLVWFDTGSIESLNKASVFIQSIEERHGISFGSIEETCFKNNLITKQNFIKFLNKNKKVNYYLNLKKNIFK